MEILIKNIKAVISGRVTETDIAISGNHFSPAGEKKYEKVIDGHGLLAVPGFIDTHIHGIGGYGTEDGTEEAILGMSKSLAKAGVTSFFPTIYTDTMERITADERAIVAAHGKEKGASIAGIHIEGPFISPNRIGAQNPLGRLEPSKEAMDTMLASGGGLIKEMTIAPELPGVEEIVKIARNKGIIPSMGHTDATYDEAMKGMDMGIRHTTHLFNAMSALKHRNPGVVGCALLNDAMSVEIIGDGKHVHPDIVKYVINTKGRDRTVIITDSLRPTMQDEGILTANGVEVMMGDGLWVTKGKPDLIQGSALTMHKAFVNLVSWGVPIDTASYITSTSAAKLYGLSDRGEIRPGLRADLVVMDMNLGIKFTVINGEIVCGTTN